MDELPVEITAEILSRIPMRYVVRCRCVCKTWKKMIDGHSFPPIFLFIPDNYHAFYLAEESETTKIEYTGPNPGNDLLLFTPPCNGFLGFTFKGSDNAVIYTYIYNPITQQCIKLPDLSKPSIQYSVVDILGLGLDPATNNFKVVHMLQRQSGIRAGPRRRALVFTLGGSDSWRKLHNYPKIACFGMSVFVNGSLYWLTKDGRILSFDLTTELFSFIGIPHFRPLNLGPSLLGLGLVDVGGRLSLFDPFNGGDIELWIMKDYKVNQSWSKLVIMKSCLERSGFPLKSVLPINSWKYGEIILYYEAGILVSYEIETGKCTQLQIKSEDGLWNDEYGFFPYVANLRRIVPPRQLAE